jgi:hypothetical protein
MAWSKLYRGILVVNVAGMLLQSVLAGKILAGNGPALVFHERIAKLLVIMAGVQLLVAPTCGLGRCVRFGFPLPAPAFCWQS